MKPTFIGAEVAPQPRTQSMSLGLFFSCENAFALIAFTQVQTMCTCNIFKPPCLKKRHVSSGQQHSEVSAFHRSRGLRPTAVLALAEFLFFCLVLFVSVSFNVFKPFHMFTI
jgi:hypothetical protein